LPDSILNHEEKVRLMKEKQTVMPGFHHSDLVIHR